MVGLAVLVDTHTREFVANFEAANAGPGIKEPARRIDPMNRARIGLLTANLDPITDRDRRRRDVEHAGGILDQGANHRGGRRGNVYRGDH